MKVFDTLLTILTKIQAFVAEMTLSKQIRDLIENCGVSRYALSQKVGVSEATLSRFLSGERSLNLSTLDKLAEVLGLEIVVTVQQLPRPRRRGRKSKKEKQMISTHKEFDWNGLAESCVKDAYETNFSSRRGVYQITDVPTTKGEVLCVYNNNPYAHFPDLRDEETEYFRKELKKAKIKELAYETYPPKGIEDAGYTYAMILDADDDAISFITDAMKKCVGESFRRMETQ